VEWIAGKFTCDVPSTVTRVATNIRQCWPSVATSSPGAKSLGSSQKWILPVQSNLPLRSSLSESVLLLAPQMQNEERMNAVALWTEWTFGAGLVAVVKVIARCNYTAHLYR
jgi:hypothetical protein